MRWTVVAVGRIRPPFADDEAHYRTMLRGQAPVEVVEVREGDDLARRIPPRAHRVALEAGGRSYTSEAFAAWVEERRRAGLPVCFLIGGPTGLGDVPRDEALSLGAMTLPHQLAR